jgi:hypothetical protein
VHIAPKLPIHPPCLQHRYTALQLGSIQVLAISVIGLAVSVPRLSRPRRRIKNERERILSQSLHVYTNTAASRNAAAAVRACIILGCGVCFLLPCNTHGYRSSQNVCPYLPSFTATLIITAIASTRKNIDKLVLLSFFSSRVSEGGGLRQVQVMRYLVLRRGHCLISTVRRQRPLRPTSP